MDRLLNLQLKDLKPLQFIDKVHVLCNCSCGKQTIVHIDNLVHGDITNCGHIQNTVVNITGRYFGEWYVDSYAGERQWNVICSCGFKDIKDGGKLRNGYSKSCKKCSRLINLAGKTFGELEVLDYAGERKWRCRCSCGKEIEVIGSSLRSGKTQSCGHNTTGWKDITGKTFGDLIAIKYMGDQMWQCKCICENTIIVDGRKLRNGHIKSCGCKRTENIKSTMLRRYGDITSAKVDNPRNIEQIKALTDRDTMLMWINAFDKKPDTYQLCEVLGVQKSSVLKAIHKMGLEDKVIIGSTISQYEHYLINYIKSISKDIKIETNNRELLNGKELDIYLPELGLAIEFNGNYWHSADKKNKYYHQRKTLACIKKGIQLIHIFEYEWYDEVKLSKILNIIRSKISDDNIIKIYARNTIIREIDKEESKEFTNKFHLQGDTNASIHIGCFIEDRLIASMTFGKPRFNNNYEYELIRFTIDSSIKIVGGAEKLFKYFIDKYNPKSVITYSDISKFTGNVYKRLGFRLTDDYITEPNYVWVRDRDKSVLSRYQTQKHKLLEGGFGNLGYTEDEIMQNLGYEKIYDSGNIKLEWIKGV